MSWPLSSQSSLHLTSDFLEDLNSDLGIYKEPPPKDVISPSYGQRYIPKLLRILSSEESSVEKKLKTLALFLTSIADDRLKAECISCPDGKVFLELLLHPNNDIKTATCKAVSKLFEFTPSREFLYKGGIVQALLNNVGEVPGAVAGCFCSLTKNRDIISTLLKREKTVQNVLVKEITVVDTLHKLLKSDDMEAREYSASSLGALSREDEGVRQVLAIGISSLLDGVKQEESLKFKNACIYTIMQLCHSYDGKIAVIGADGVETLASCLSTQEEETQTLAMAALLGLSTELEAKERISNACTEQLMRLQYSPSPQLKSNTENLISSISEFPAARAKFEKSVLVVS